MKNENNKEIFTEYHAQRFYQTLADILAEKYAPNVEVTVTIKEKTKE